MFSFTSKNKMESRIFRIFWNDGLLDILAGVGLVLIGCAWLLDIVPLGAIAPAILIPFWKPLRARITEPRLGFVEVSDVQQNRNRNFMITSLVMGVVTFLIGIAVYLVVVGVPGELSIGIAALPAIIIAFMALMTAAFTSSHRFILYASFLLVCGMVVSWLNEEPGWSLLAGGLAAVAGGGIVLSRFILQHSIASEREE